MTDSDQSFARYTRSYWNDYPEERESIVQEHVARIRQGVDVWNDFDQAFADYLTRKNTRIGAYIFRGAKLDRISFEGATFSVHADFSHAQFYVYGSFVGATFSAHASFESATFNGGANFERATFNSDAYFGKVKIVDYPNIISVGEEKIITYPGDAYFQKAKFGGRANFAGVEFGGMTDFSDATFKSICSFNLSTLSSEEFVPNFINVQYKTAPLMEGWVIPWVKDSPTVNIEKYRQLKKIAIDSANHEQEVRFFAYETRCKMYMKYPALTKFSIRLYWVFSNFGQSLLRPLGALVLVWIVATAMTISTTMKTPIPKTLVSLIMFEHLEPCEVIPSNAFRSKIDAIRSQSIGSSLTLPVIAMDRYTQHQRNQCLYGQGGGVPETNRIINGIQQVLSLIFLFLCGLAVRNRFKIK